MKKGQSDRLTAQQKEGQGPISIFHEDAQIHDKEVGNTSIFAKNGNSLISSFLPT